jgi:hypothetical protein
MYNQVIPPVADATRKARTMSTELINLLDAINLISSTLSKVSGITYAWDKLYNAGQYLQRQVKPMIEG